MKGLIDISAGEEVTLLPSLSALLRSSSIRIIAVLTVISGRTSLHFFHKTRVELRMEIRLDLLKLFL